MLSPEEATLQPYCAEIGGYGSFYEGSCADPEAQPKNNNAEDASNGKKERKSGEPTKCKPVAVSLAVEYKSRWTLGYEVAQMPAKNLMVAKSLKRYGKRIDERPLARVKLFTRIQNFMRADSLIKTDENPHYMTDIKKFFPKATYQTFKGRKSSLGGQGELKKVGFDPIFSLNHTCAVLRYRTCRLIRKTWNTTKKKERLGLHLALIVLHHNLNLRSSRVSTA